MKSQKVKKTAKNKRPLNMNHQRVNTNLKKQLIEVFVDRQRNENAVDQISLLMKMAHLQAKNGAKNAKVKVEDARRNCPIQKKPHFHLTILGQKTRGQENKLHPVSQKQ